MSFTAKKAPITAATTEEQGFWPFGLTDETNALFDSSGLFETFGGVIAEETAGSVFTIENGPGQGPGLLKRITAGLVAMVRYLMVVGIHYPWLMFGSSGCCRGSTIKHQPTT